MSDRQDIADLMTGWMHRDLGEWDALRDLFTPEARIEVTWFTGTASDFVEASARMGASHIKTKHLITSPLIRFSEDGRRAVSETNAIIVAEHAPLGLGCHAHCRFIDRLEKEDGRWRIASRHCVYDLASFTYPSGVVDIDQDLVGAHPSEYAALAFLLVKAGFDVQGIYPTRGSAAERELKAAGSTWLTEVTS